jgi:hypothetical protein
MDCFMVGLMAFCDVLSRITVGVCFVMLASHGQGRNLGPVCELEEFGVFSF